MDRSNPFRIRFCTTLCVALLAMPFALRAQEQVVMTTSGPGSVGTEEITTITATVTAVDHKARTVTLKGPEGNEMTMPVGEEVKRLNEVKVGDLLDVGYLEAVGLDFREATAEEMKNPLTETIESDKADKTRAPAAAALRTVRAVVTLEGMSRWLNVLTVKGPRGNYFVVEVEPGMVKWESLRIGQTMVATYSEALVMSITPSTKAAKK